MTGEELNRELLKWAGFIPLDNKTNCWQEWQFPDGSKHYAGDLPDFTDPVWGIAHCFKWLVPWLPMDKINFTISFEYNSNPLYKGGVCWISTLGEYEDSEGDGGSDLVYSEDGKTPALALYNAIEKLVQGEG